MRAFVTGATGFVGSHLVRRLLAAGFEVAVLLRSPRRVRRIGDLLGRVTCISGELRRVAAFAPRLAEFAPDVMFHLGWHGANRHALQSSRDQVYRNVPGSLNLVRAAAATGCRKFVGLGSVLEYGRFDAPITEDSAASPRNLYAGAKHSVGQLSELLCRSLGVDFAWLRLTWGYGPDDDPARMIPYAIDRLLQGARPALTAGEQQWDYLYIDDLVEAIHQAALCREATGIFNLGSGQPVRLRAVVEGIRDEIDPRLPLGLGEVPYREDQPMRLEVCVDRLRKHTGWFPRVSIEEGIRRTVAWHRQALARGVQGSGVAQKRKAESRRPFIGFRLSAFGFS